MPLRRSSLCLPIAVFAAASVLAACGTNTPNARSTVDAGGGVTDAAYLTPRPTIAGDGVAQTCAVRISWGNLAQHFNEKVSVQGPVVHTSRDLNARDQPTILEVGNPRPEAGGLDILIPDYSLPRFDAPPEQLYGGKTICALGVPQRVGDRFQFAIGSSTEIGVVPAGAATLQSGVEQQCGTPVSPEAASSENGKTVAVQGVAAGTRSEQLLDGNAATIIELGSSAPDTSGMDIVISAAVRSNFTAPPEALYAGHTVCVYGAISIVDGRARTFIDSPSALYVRP